jgi:hypothetical protein
MLEIPPNEVREPHKITIELRFSDDPEREALARIEGAWDSTDSAVDERLPTYLPVIIDLQQVAIPEPGYYEFRIDLEGVEPRTILLRANTTGDAQAP